MESNRPTRHDRRGRLNVPERDSTDTPEGLTPVRNSLPTPKLSSTKKNAADDDNLFGFNDTSADEEKMDDVRFVDIFRAWGKRAVQHSPLEKYLSANREKKKHLKRMTNDLKWAMQADLDEPVAPRPKQPKPVQPKQPQNPRQAATPPTENETKTIDININFGSLPKIRRSAFVAKLRKFVQGHKKGVGAASIIAALLISYFVVWSPIQEYNASQGKPGGDSTAAAKSPDYSTVLPKERSISQLGGWKRISPANSNPVFAYADKVDDVTISVSQQPLPEAFKNDLNSRIADLAKQFSATTKLDANGTDVYIGTSAKGPQSVIFSKNGLLVLIKSQQKAEDKSWVAYVESLVGTDPTLSNY